MSGAPAADERLAATELDAAVERLSSKNFARD
jgi:hypothetical protein